MKLGTIKHLTRAELEAHCVELAEALLAARVDYRRQAERIEALIRATEQVAA